MTPLGPVLHGLGLTIAETARWLDLRQDTVKSWCNGRRIPNPAVLDKLHRLAARQLEMASGLAAAYGDAIRAAGGHLPDCIDLPDLDEVAAREIGLPSAGSYRAVVRRLWEMLPEGAVIRLVDPGDAAVAQARQLRKIAGR